MSKKPAGRLSCTIHTTQLRLVIKLAKCFFKIVVYLTLRCVFFKAKSRSLCTGISKLPIQSCLVLMECFQTDKSGTEDLHRDCQREASEGEARILQLHQRATTDMLNQERIEPAKPAREHATMHVNYIDGEIQTWRPYSK